MRRRIALYIADRKVDLDDQGLVLLNYAMEDLTNPTIVKNSYSQQITLPGTPDNNKIFGGSFRLDRRIANQGGNAGVDFNPSQKTPFTIYNEMNEVLESGYAKLDSVSRNGADVQYKVTLYGGLGSFLYGLSYDDEGNKKTLADITYLNGNNPETELDFVINKNNIQESWSRLLHTDVTLSPFHTDIGKSLKVTGEISPDGAADRVYQYRVNGLVRLRIAARRPNSSLYAMAVCLDSNGNVLQVYEQGQGSGTAYDYSSYDLTLPEKAYTLRVYRNTNNPTASIIISPIWDILNFAPAYNGIPDGDFSADKAVVKPGDVNLDDEVGDYTTKNGYCLVNLSKAMTEWEVKDLRSYLQRPVLSMKAFLTALQRASNAGGYNVSMPFLDKADFAPFKAMWLTLPMLPSLGTFRQSSGDLSMIMVASLTSAKDMARYSVQGTMPSGTTITANINVKLRFDATSGKGHLYRGVKYNSSGYMVGNQTIYFLQAVAYASDDTIVGGSKVKCIYDWNLAPSDMADAMGYVPPFQGEDIFDPQRITENQFTEGASGSYLFDKEIGFSVNATDVAKIVLNVTAYEIVTRESGSVASIMQKSGGTSCIGKLYKDSSNYYTPTNGLILQGTLANTITYASADSLRSGATITKQMLLSTSRTPAEYLLSFCKIFGLHILVDEAEKAVTILDRNDLYQDEVIDLTGRIDISHDMGFNPIAFSAKWYDFKIEGAGGAFLDEYKNIQGIDYGIQRVNTGYDFDANVVNLLDGNVFKNGATILDRSQYFVTINIGAKMIPSVFMDAGTTYTLWDSSGNSSDIPISMPPSSAVITPFNAARPGYDIELARKMEFRTKDNKPVDGSDVLLFYEGKYTYSYFKLSDDNSAMTALNGGVPCWDLTPGASLGIQVPSFQRYITNQNNEISASLDFGVPKELDIPGITYHPEATLYSRFWKRYLTDRFDVDTKVMTCRVNFAGLQVGNDLLRKFYWYDNALWVLNAIRNYSLTTYDSVECEFVQVQDTDNYLDGQY